MPPSPLWISAANVPGKKQGHLLLLLKAIGHLLCIRINRNHLEQAWLPLPLMQLMVGELQWGHCPPSYLWLGCVPMRNMAFLPETPAQCVPQGCLVVWPFIPFAWSEHLAVPGEQGPDIASSHLQFLGDK